MPSFLRRFFPSVYRKQQEDATTNQYCQYDSPTLTLFTSSLYLAALISSLVASTVTRKFGRRLSMLFGGILFCAGALVNGFAKRVWMLIVGRILLGLVSVSLIRSVTKSNNFSSSFHTYTSRVRKSQIKYVLFYKIL